METSATTVWRTCACSARPTMPTCTRTCLTLAFPDHHRLLDRLTLRAHVLGCWREARRGPFRPQVLQLLGEGVGSVAQLVSRIGHRRAFQDARPREGGTRAVEALERV